MDETLLFFGISVRTVNCGKYYKHDKVAIYGHRLSGADV